MIDLFAGPGGWDEGAKPLGIAPIGVEWDMAACRTATAAGHARICADVARLPTEPMVGKVWGLIASPPCQAWSAAGARKGEQDRENCHRLADRMAEGDDDTAWTTWEDPRSALVCQPIRWVRDLRPEWIALEQVPPVHTLWEHFARIFRGWGYSVWTGDLSSEQYGVPQTRQRRILIGSRVRTVGPPPATHTAYVKGTSRHEEPDLFGDQLLPWVSLAEGLRAVWPDWHPMAASYHLSRGAGMLERHGERPDTPVDRPAPVITSKARTAEWVLDTGQTSKTSRGPEPYTRPLDAPSPTLTAQASGFWHYRNGNQPNSALRALDEPAPTILFGHRSNDVRWVEERPATTVVGSFCPDVISAPGYRTKESRQNAEGGVKVTVAEGGVLQSFPPDYPWFGSRTKQFEQVGNAVPPRLATHVLAAASGCAIAATTEEAA